MSDVVSTVKKELKKMVDLLDNSEESPSSTASTELIRSEKRKITPKSEVQSLFPNIFRSRQLSGSSCTRRHRTGKKKPAAATTCTLNFCCLAHQEQCAPTKDEASTLKLAGLGRKKVTFTDREGDHLYVQTELETVYSKLHQADGKFLMYKGRSGTNRLLTKIKMGPKGYTVDWLRDTVGSSIIYIMPLQVKLSLEPEVTSGVSEVLTFCSQCGQDVPLNTFDEHLSICNVEDEDTSSDEMEEQLEARITGKRSLVPVCSGDRDGKKPQKQLKVTKTHRVILTDEEDIDSLQDALPDLEPSTSHFKDRDGKKPKKQLKVTKTHRVILTDEEDIDSLQDALPDLEPSTSHFKDRDGKKPKKQLKVTKTHRVILTDEEDIDSLQDALPDLEPSTSYFKAERQVTRPECVSQKLKECPVCCGMFPESSIEVHANQCCERRAVEPVADYKEIEDKPEKSTWTEAMERLRDLALKDKSWDISVIRSEVSTVMDVFEDADEEEWANKMKVTFVGEEGLDCGGLQRELFTLLFSSSPLLNGQSFTVSSVALKKKHYRLLGKAVAYAILTGHPGLQRLNPVFVKYLLSGKEPDNLRIETTFDARVDCVINMIEEADDDNALQSLPEEASDLLDRASFNGVLKKATKKGAVQALKQHFGFYGQLGALVQFREGLQLHGVLDTMKQFSEDASKALSPHSVCATDLTEFYKPSYSAEGSNNRAVEVKVVFNLHRFITQIGKKKVSSQKLDLASDETSEIQFTLAQVCTVLLGSPALPTDKESGIIVFQHEEEKLPTFNTCAPSITFHGPHKLVNYDNFKQTMVDALLGSEGYFGIA